jgi:sugar O-acyltransferase (sialic acid O-acetyltransferase NeuD family)
MSDASGATDDLLLIFGAGGFGREVAWLATSVGHPAANLRFLVEPGYDTPPEVDDVAVLVLGEDEVAPDARCVVAIGDPSARQRAAALCRDAGLPFSRLVHPNVHMSSRVEVGAGGIVCAGSVLTTNVVLGQHVQVHVTCTIGHDVGIGDFTTITPGVNIAGNVVIGSGVYVGTGATVINGAPGDPLIIGDGAVVAAGACVTRSVPPGAMVAGVPAVRKR